MLTQSAKAAAREALKKARRQAGLSPLVDDEPTLRVIVAVIGSHLERQSKIHSLSTNIHNDSDVVPVLEPTSPDPNHYGGGGQVATNGEPSARPETGE